MASPHRPYWDELDLTRPNIARMWNYLLDGKDNYEVDRAAVLRILDHAPELFPLARAGREFLAGSIRQLSQQPAIDQFLDLGTGMPISPTVHEMAARHQSSPRVAYIDNDIVSVTHARALLDEGGTVTVEGDITDPHGILENPALNAVIDFSRPVAVLMSSVLHFIPDEQRPADILAAFRAALAPRSALVISHICLDGVDPARRAEIDEVFAATGTPLVSRDRAQIAELFSGFDLGDGGLSEITCWPLSAPRRTRPAVACYGGVARYLTCRHQAA